MSKIPLTQITGQGSDMYGLGIKDLGLFKFANGEWTKLESPPLEEGDFVMSLYLHNYSGLFGPLNYLRVLTNKGAVWQLGFFSYGLPERNSKNWVELTK